MKHILYLSAVLLTGCAVPQNDSASLVCNGEPGPEFEKAKAEFKSWSDSGVDRRDAAKALRPYLVVGTSKAAVMDILGEPSEKHSKTNMWFYGLYWSHYITIEFDEQGLLKHVDPVPPFE